MSSLVAVADPPRDEHLAVGLHGNALRLVESRSEVGHEPAVVRERRIQVPPRTQPDHGPTRRARSPMRRRRARTSRRLDARSRVLGRLPGRRRPARSPSPSNVGSSRPVVVYRTASNTGTNDTSAHPAATTRPSGCTSDVGELLCARADVGGHPPVAPEAAIEATVRQVARHGGAARDAVRRRAGDHDAPAGSDRHRARALEPASEPRQRRARRSRSRGRASRSAGSAAPRTGRMPRRRRSPTTTIPPSSSIATSNA